MHLGHKYLYYDAIKFIRAFCCVVKNQLVVPNGYRMDYVITWNTEISYPDMPSFAHSIEIGMMYGLGLHVHYLII